MKKITVKEFAEQILTKAPGVYTRFFVTDEDFRTSEYVITLVQCAGSCCLLANCAGGGHPLVIDVTIYDTSLLNICDTLDKYINGSSGNYGYVDVIEKDQGGQDAVSEAPAGSGTHMLISVTERTITTAFFSSHEEAYARMEKELDETMGGRRDEYKLEYDYEIGSDSAWSNANNTNSDWLIVEMNGGIAMNTDGNPPSVRYSVHLEMKQLEAAAHKYLSSFFDREIKAYYDRREYYHWGFNIADTPLSKEEIEQLFLAAGADAFDRDSNDFGEYPIMEINQGLAEKMLATELPFIMDESHADDTGVWFFGPRGNEQVNILLYYPETDMESDIIRVLLKDGVSANDLTHSFWDAMEEVDTETGASNEDNDRLSKLDAVIERVSKKIGCKLSVHSITFSAGII